MSDEKNKALIESLAAELVMAAPDDRTALRSLREGFQRIDENGAPEVDGSETCQDIVAALAAAEDTMELAPVVLSRAEALIGQWQQKLSGNGGSAELETATESAAPVAPPELTQDTDEEILREFVSRQITILQDCEGHLLALERGDAAALAALRRIWHTLKGEAQMLGLEDISRVCHAAEEVMPRQQPGAPADLLFSIRDWMQAAVQHVGGKGKDPGDPAALLRQVEEAGQDAPQQSDTQPPLGNEPEKFDVNSLGLGDEIDELRRDFCTEASEHLDAAELLLLALEVDTDDPEPLDALFRSFHSIKGNASFVDLPEVQHLAHEVEAVLADVRRGKLNLSETTIDTIFDVIDALRQMLAKVRGDTTTLSAGVPDGQTLVTRLRSASNNPATSVPPRSSKRSGGNSRPLGDLLLMEGALQAEHLQAALERQKQDPESGRLGEMLVQEKAVPARKVAKALRRQRTETETSTAIAASLTQETLRVDAQRLDKLVDLVGELAIAESMLYRTVSERFSIGSTAARHLDSVQKLTRELQETASSLRMIPLRTTFQRMARLARDLARKAAKPVDFRTVGEDTELDKSVVDAIGDPLVHLIRNAIDHGLEPSAEARLRAGKPETGRVELAAYHRSGNVFIEVRDDGQGMNREAILRRARERGLIGADENPDDQEVYRCVLEPGFSTAEKVTEVSGRGVGMDVVKQTIECLRGGLDIHSEPGRGTTFVFRLPLTLAMIEGMVVRVGAEQYIVPTHALVRSLLPRPGMIVTLPDGRGHVVKLTHEMLPLVDLGRLLHTSTNGRDANNNQIILVVEEANRRFALLVNELLNKQQLVIKSLGPVMSHVQGLAGGAVLPDGRVGLILDVATLADQAARVR